LPLCKEEDERSHKRLWCCASSLATTSGRRRKQELLPNCTHLGRALMRPRWRKLGKAKAPAALEKPSGGGVPRGVPLVPFLATSWGMPRSSIGTSAARCAADEKGNAKFQTTSPLDAHTASRVRCAVSVVLSLSLNKERTKENQPKAAAFGNCSFAALQKGTREITYTLFVLCLKFSQHERQAKKARAFAKTNPSWACAHAPKMEEAWEGKSPGGSQKAVGRWGPKGCPLGSLLGYFLGNAKK